MTKLIAFLALLVFCLVAVGVTGGNPEAANPSDIARSVVRSRFERGTQIALKLRGLFLKNYRFQLVGETMLDGKDTWVLVAKSRFRKQPCRLLWVDKSCSKVLAVKDWSCRSRLKLVKKYPSHRVGEISHLDLSEDHLACKPSYLPAGFAYIGTRKTPNGWWQHVYSDGLYALSIFSRFFSRGEWEHARQEAICLSIASLVVCRSWRNLELVLVGDLPADELRRIGNSIK